MTSQTIKQYQQDPYQRYIQKVSSAESGNRTSARNPFGAAGLYQFVPSTWRSLNEKYNLGYTQDDRLDPQKSDKVMKLFTEENRKYLKKSLGREPDDYELYLAHGFGAAGAKNLINKLSENPNITTAEYFSPLIQKQNRALLFNKDGSAKTIAEVSNHFRQKMNAPIKQYKNSEKTITPQEALTTLSEVNNKLTDLVFSKELPNFAGTSYIPEEEKDEDIKVLQEKETEKEQLPQRQEQAITQNQTQEETVQEDIAQYYVDPNQLYQNISNFVEMQNGGEIIRDNQGYWNPQNHGKIVQIDSPHITMKGVNQPLLGISQQTGERKLMQPGLEYFFNNTNSVIEIPIKNAR